LTPSEQGGGEAMQRGRVNDRILQGIRRQSGDDRAMSDFLTKMLYREAEHPSRWRSIYKEAVDESSRGWREDDED